MRYLTKLAAATSVAVVGLTLTAQIATAHHGEVATANGFMSGFLHPWTGLDHLLAIFAIGLWATLFNRRSRWLIPGAFLGVMTVSAMMAGTGLVLPGVEAGITLSTILLGLALLVSMRLAPTLGIIIASCLAISHGYAHGLEMPIGVSPLHYGLGFIFATAMIQAIGVAVGTIWQQQTVARQQFLFRVAGAVVLLGGLFASAV